jgi:hypothetical protein
MACTMSVSRVRPGSQRTVARSPGTDGGFQHATDAANGLLDHAGTGGAVHAADAQRRIGHRLPRRIGHPG